MKNRLLMVLTSALAMIAVGLGTTLALFSDSETTSTDFVAGTLCLHSERNDGDPVPGPMFYVTPAQGATPGGQLGTYPTGVWAPGDLHDRTLTIKNDTACSNLDAWVKSVRANIHAGGYLPMADKLWVEIWTPQSGTDVKVAEGWLSQFVAGPVPTIYPDGTKIPLYLSSNRHMEFRVKFDRSADNSYQDKTLIVDFTVEVEQMDNNP